MPFAQQELGARPYQNREFQKIVQMLDIELQGQHKPTEFEVVTVICNAAALIFICILLPVL